MALTEISSSVSRFRFCQLLCSDARNTITLPADYRPILQLCCILARISYARVSRM